MNQSKYEVRFLKMKGDEIPVVMMIDPSVEHVFITGSVDYGAANEGIIESAHALEHFVYAGTKKFPGKKLVVDAVEDTGGSCNAGTMDMMTSFFAKLPDDYCSLGIDWVTDLMFSPLLKEEDFDTQEEMLQAGIPDRLMPEKFLQALQYLPDCAGIALGLDRLLMLLLGCKNLAEVLPLADEDL